MKTILVTGHTGMLGNDLVKQLQADLSVKVFGVSRSLSAALAPAHQFCADLTDETSVSALDFAADVIIHAAALTDLAACENNPDLAYRVHELGTKHATKLLKKGGRFFYISTDSVFDGEGGCYKESDQTNPLNEYAISKLKGENVVRATLGNQATIVRTNIYGVHEPRKNSLAEWAFKSWNENQSISGFTDVIFNAVFTSQLAAVLKHLINSDHYFPSVNVGSSEALSKFEFLDRLRKTLLVDESLLKAAVSENFPSKIKRPKNTTLDTSLLSTFYKVPDMTTGIQLCAQYLTRQPINSY